MPGDTLVCGRHGGEALPGAGIHGRGDIAATVPDVHAVPGGYPEEPADQVVTGGQEWLAIEAETGAPLIRCSCWPSVRASRHGERVGRIVIHHAHDQRASGQVPS